MYYYYLYLHCCLQSCKVRHVSPEWSSVFKQNHRDVTGCFATRCIYGFSGYIVFVWFYFGLNHYIYLVSFLSVLKPDSCIQRCIYSSDKVNEVSVFSVQRLQTNPLRGNTISAVGTLLKCWRTRSDQQVSVLPRQYSRFMTQHVL